MYPTLNGGSSPNTHQTSDPALQWVDIASPYLGIFLPPNENFLPCSPSVSYTFILLRETLTSAAALTEKGKIAIENSITLNMVITLNAWRTKKRYRIQDGMLPWLWTIKSTGIKLPEMRNSSTVGILRGKIFSFHGSEIMGWQIEGINILNYFAFGFSPKWWETYPLISVNPEDKVWKGPLIEGLWKSPSIPYPYLA